MAADRGRFAMSGALFAERERSLRLSKSIGSFTPFSPLSMTSSSVISGGGFGSMRPPGLGRSKSLVERRGPASAGGVDSKSTRRMSVLLGTNPGSVGPAASTPLNIHEGPKALSPDQVVSLAESLRSPLLAHD